MTERLQPPSTKLKFGTELIVNIGYGGGQIRVADNGQVLIGVFSDRLREYPTDYTFEQAETVLRNYERAYAAYQESTRRS